MNDRLHILFRIDDRIEKGWIQEYFRSSKKGTKHRVSGYWRHETRPIEHKTWKDYGLEKWADMMRRKSPMPVKRIRSADELESYLLSLENVFQLNKDGWITVPTADRLYASIEPGLYRHWVQRYGNEEADRGISYFRAVIDTLIQPWEIWRQSVPPNDDDGRVFLKGFAPDDNPHASVMVMVAFRQNKPIIWTVIPTTKYREVDKRRYGELLFQDDE